MLWLLQTHVLTRQLYTLAYSKWNAHITNAIYPFSESEGSVSLSLNGTRRLMMILFACNYASGITFAPFATYVIG